MNPDLVREIRASVAGTTRRHVAPFKLESVTDHELRADGESDLATGEFAIRGYAAVFDRLTTLMSGPDYIVQEKIARGAFRKALDEHQDTVSVWDHDTRWILGRVSNDTLRLKEDPRGLNTYTKVAPTSYAADLRTLIERKDINAQSFSFTVNEDVWTEETKDGFTTMTREIRAVKNLFDVSPVAQPAYPQTDVSVARERIVLPETHISFEGTTIDADAIAEIVKRALLDARKVEISTDPETPATDEQRGGEAATGDDGTSTEDTGNTNSELDDPTDAGTIVGARSARTRLADFL